MRILDFEMRHLEDAKLIAFANYNEERKHVPILPAIDMIPSLNEFARNGLGVVAFEKGKIVGFLCCYKPWENAFNSRAIGTFSPIHAHGSVKENRGNIYKRMYQVAAEKWVKHKITYHAIALYSHDLEAISAMFTYGFGLRCVDAIKPMEVMQLYCRDEIKFEELSKADVIQIREMRQMLSQYLGNSPCFMYSTHEQFASKLARAEARNTRLFVAREGEKPIAFVEVSQGGENFVTEVSDMCNICGAFSLPEYRGENIYQNLLNFAISKLKAEGYKMLGVDFESFNSTANAFWLKYFTAYTSSVVRRIDECALHD